MQNMYLVVFARGDNKEDRSDRFKTLVPFLTLRPLTSDVYEFEWNVVDGDVVLVDALRRVIVEYRYVHVTFSIIHSIL